MPAPLPLILVVEDDEATLKTHAIRLRAHPADRCDDVTIANVRDLGYRLDVVKGEEDGRGREACSWEASCGRCFAAS